MYSARTASQSTPFIFSSKKLSRSSRHIRVKSSSRSAAKSTSSSALTGAAPRLEVVDLLPIGRPLHTRLRTRCRCELPGDRLLLRELIQREQIEIRLAGGDRGHGHGFPIWCERLIDHIEADRKKGDSRTKSVEHDRGVTHGIAMRGVDGARRAVARGRRSAVPLRGGIVRYGRRSGGRRASVATRSRRGLRERLRRWWWCLGSEEIAELIFSKARRSRHEVHTREHAGFGALRRDEEKEGAVGAPRE